MEIIEYISQGGLLVVGAVAVYLVFLYFKEKIESMSVRKPNNHKFFSEINYYITNKIPNIKLKHHGKYDEGRTMIFRDILTTKLSIWRRELLNSVNKKTVSCLSEMTETINNIIREYTREWERLGIPKVVIDKFNERHLPHANLLISGMEDVCGSTGFHNRQEKLNAILHLHTMILVLVVIDAEKTLGDLNGQLNGLVYKDIVIGGKK